MITKKITSALLNELKRLKVNEADIIKLDDIRTLTFDKGETILKQNNHATHVIFVEKGLLKIVVEGNKKRNLIVKIIPAGHFVGLPILDDNDHNPYSVLAIKFSEILLIKKQDILNLTQNNITFYKQLYKYEIETIRYLYRKLGMIGMKNALGRFADTILELSASEFQDEKIYDYFSRKEIAEYTGISLESVNKLMVEFKNDKLILQKGKQVIINDIEMIQRLSDFG